MHVCAARRGVTSAAVVTKYMSLHRETNGRTPTAAAKKNLIRLIDTCSERVQRSETEMRKKAHDSIKCFVFSIARQSADKSKEKFQIYGWLVCEEKHKKKTISSARMEMYVARLAVVCFFSLDMRYRATVPSSSSTSPLPLSSSSAFSAETHRLIPNQGKTP